MAQFTYFEPSGDQVDDPTVDQILAFMRKNGEYWGPYSPVGYIYRDDNAGRVMLYFVRHSRRGWYLEHDFQNDRNRHFVAFDPTGNRDGWVEHWAEGDTSFFLEACFLSQAAAEQVVRDFFASPEPSPAISWEPVRWDTHRMEGPPEDESRVVETAEEPE